MRVATIKSTVAAAAIAMVGAMPSAHAAGQVDSKSLTDVLVAKGVLTKDEAKAVSKSNDHKLTLGLTSFVTLTTKETQNNGAGWAAASQGTQSKTQGVGLDRVYLTGKYYINDTWKMRITTDVASETAAGLGKTTNVYLKYAYLQGDFMPELSLRFGVIHTAWIDHEEHLWGHRYVTKSMVDDLGIDSSADAGIGIAGKAMGGLINYQIAEVNGGGYGNLTATKGQDLSTRLGINPIDGLTIDFGFRDGYRAQKTFTGGAQANPVGKQTTAQAMVTYGSGHSYRIGLNYAIDKDKAKNSLKTTAYAIWGHAELVETGMGTLGIFGRYQHAKIQPYNAIGGLVANLVDETKQHNAIGLELKPTKGMAVSLVYDNVDTKNLVSGAGTAAATTTTNKNTRVRTIGLFGVVDF